VVEVKEYEILTRKLNVPNKDNRNKVKKERTLLSPPLVFKSLLELVLSG